MTESDLQLDRIFTDSPHGASFAFYSGGIKPMLRTLWTTALDVIFPSVCVGCDRVGALLCEHCIEAIQSPPSPPSPSGEIAAFVAVGAHTTALRDALRALKYEGERRMGEVLGRLLAEKVIEKEWPIDMVIPVPLHSQRLAERGYNQANEIAKTLATEIRGSLASDALDKVRATTSQVELSAVDRQHNVEGAFKVAESYQQHLQDKIILLVDDVCTTGSTLMECAAALRDAGVARVYVATVTRAGSTLADSLSGNKHS